MGSKDEKAESLISEEQLENLRLIFEPDKTILSDEDYSRLASLVEDENDESAIYIDHDFDTGPGN
jgi:hypothetical protein